MKVCMFALVECDPYYISARRVAKTLTEAGHDVTIIAYLDKGLPAREKSDGYTILRLRLLSLRIRNLRLAGWLTQRTIRPRRARDLDSHPSIDQQANNLKHSPHNPVLARNRFSLKSLVAAFLTNAYWHMYRTAVYLLYAEYQWRAFWLARKERADVYHAHDLNTLPVAWLCSRVSKGGLVYDSHELWVDRERRPPRSRINRFLVRKMESFLIHRAQATIILGVSSGQELTRRYHIEPIVVHNAWFYRPFSPSSLLRDELQLPSGKKILLYVGIFNLSRGLEESIQSLVYLPDCVFVMLGWGSEEYVSGLKRLAASDGVTERVYFHGPVSFDQITPYAMSADVGLILMKNIGLNYYYVSPNKIFQFMVAGLPVVASNFPDLKMFVEGYHFGVTCDPESPREIASAVDRVLSNGSRYSQMRLNALEAAKTFNWENESKKLVLLYSELSQKTSYS